MSIKAWMLRAPVPALERRDGSLTAEKVARVVRHLGRHAIVSREQATVVVDSPLRDAGASSASGRKPTAASRRSGGAAYAA